MEGRGPGGHRNWSISAMFVGRDDDRRTGFIELRRDQSQQSLRQVGIDVGRSVRPPAGAAGAR